MAESFKRPGGADFEPLKQSEIRGDFRPITNDQRVDTPPSGPSRAEVLLDDYDKTIAFTKWLEGIIDEQCKDVVVNIDPEEQPEVWMAMQRIFSNPSPKISYQSYIQVMKALEEVDTAETEVNDPFAEEDQFIDEYLKQVGDDSTPLADNTIEMVVEDETVPTESPIANTANWPQSK